MYSLDMTLVSRREEDDERVPRQWLQHRDATDQRFEVRYVWLMRLNGRWLRIDLHDGIWQVLIVLLRWIWLNVILVGSRPGASIGAKMGVGYLYIELCLSVLINGH